MMRKLKVSGIFVMFVLLISCTTEKGDQTNAPNKSPQNTVAYTDSKIIIDGNGSDEGWKSLEWRDIDQNWLGEKYTKEDFSGKYKITWNEDQIFVLAEIVDDKLIDLVEDGLVNYWDDDCLEVFIDENASGGNHQYNNNAFAYHIALDGKVVDIGADSSPHYYNHIQSVRKTKGTTTTWELSMDVYDDSYAVGKASDKVALKNKKEIGFAIAYCDNDNSEARENFIGSAVVEGEDKNRGWIDAGIFEKFVLVK